MHVCASSHRALATLLHERTPSNGTLFDDKAMFAEGSCSVHAAASTSVRIETAGAQATHLAKAELKALAQEESQVSFLVCQGQLVFALAVKSRQEQIPGSAQHKDKYERLRQRVHAMQEHDELEQVTAP
jgi:hypothetical protein